MSATVVATGQTGAELDHAARAALDALRPGARVRAERQRVRQRIENAARRADHRAARRADHRAADMRAAALARAATIRQRVADGRLELDAALRQLQSIAPALDRGAYDAAVDLIDAAAVLSGVGLAAPAPAWSDLVRRAERGGDTDAETRRRVRRGRRHLRAGEIPAARGTAASDPRATGSDPRTARVPVVRDAVRRHAGEDAPRRWTSGVAPVPYTATAPGPAASVLLRPVWAVDTAGVVADAAEVFAVEYAQSFGPSAIPGGRHARRATASTRVLAPVVQGGTWHPVFVVGRGGTAAATAPVLGDGTHRARDLGPASPWRVPSVAPQWSPCAACAADPVAVASGGSVHCPSHALAQLRREARAADAAERAERTRQYRKNGWTHA